MKKIIIAVDDSPFSAHVIESVCKRSWPADTQFKLLTVLEKIDMDYPQLDWDRVFERVQDQRIEHATKVLGKERKRIEDHIPDATVHFEIRHGSPKVEILKAAAEWDADKIIVGAHGRDVCPHFLLGSVSRAVASGAKCAVEVVRPKEGKPSEERAAATCS